jgi:glycine cleavage system aminomethyltransferase T
MQLPLSPREDGLDRHGLDREERADFRTAKGGVRSELTVTRVAPDRFLLLAASSAEWHNEDYLRACPLAGDVTIENLTARYSTLVVADPQSRRLLRKITGADLGTEAFPWLSCRNISVGAAPAPALALRVNYVGELGWELHVTMENLVSVYEAIWEAGLEHEIRDFGLYAIESMRLEKCYRAWKQDLSTEWSALAAGLSRFVKPQNPRFRGREAILVESERGPAERFVPLLVEDTAPNARLLDDLCRRPPGRAGDLRRLRTSPQEVDRARLCPVELGDGGVPARHRDPRRTTPCHGDERAALRSVECAAQGIAPLPTSESRELKP